MIIEYHRPKKLDEALRLLARETPITLPIGGGSTINRSGEQPVAVVDLQSLGLGGINYKGSTLELGATLTLQTLLEAIENPTAADHPGRGLHILKQVLLQEASHNLRQIATVAGALVASDGRSPFAAALLALDAVVRLEPGRERVGIGEVLALRNVKLHHKLITQINLPASASLAYESVARSPLDKPVVCAAAAVWPSGRARLALGGFGLAPLLILDGVATDEVELAAASAYSQAEDAWASAEYRSEIAGVLARRVLLSASQS